MSDQPKRRGRPPLPPANRRRFNLTFRVRTDLRDRLAAIAEANCRSISEEVEYRLEASFKDADIRQIVREEIAAAREVSSVPTVSHVTSVSAVAVKGHEPGSRTPVQIGGDGRSARDWVWL